MIPEMLLDDSVDSWIATNNKIEKLCDTRNLVQFSNFKNTFVIWGIRFF